jgi:hypothetical protein
MSANVLNQLKELQSDSGIYLPQATTAGFKAHLESNGNRAIELVQPVQIANAHWTMKPRNGSSSLAKKENIHRERRVMTLSVAQEENFTYRLNTALLGGKSYPVLTAVLGAASGIASMGAGLLFAAATTGLDVMKPSNRVLARTGDEVWQVEEIGKITNGSAPKAIHINSYFLVDPYRKQTLKKGWLIHETRSEITLG